MKKVIIAIVLCLVLANVAHAIDGVAWNEMSYEEKARYLMGIYEGMAFYEAQVLRRPPDEWEIYKYFPTKFSLHVTMQSVDLFYADVTNKLFPLSSVLYILTMELDIDKKEIIEAYKARVRSAVRSQHRF